MNGSPFRNGVLLTVDLYLKSLKWYVKNQTSFAIQTEFEERANLPPPPPKKKKKIKIKKNKKNFQNIPILENEMQQVPQHHTKDTRLTRHANVPSWSTLSSALQLVARVKRRSAITPDLL